MTPEKRDVAAEWWQSLPGGKELAQYALARHIPKEKVLAFVLDCYTERGGSPENVNRDKLHSLARKILNHWSRKPRKFIPNPAQENKVEKYRVQTHADGSPVYEFNKPVIPDPHECFDPAPGASQAISPRANPVGSRAVLSNKPVRIDPPPLLPPNGNRKRFAEWFDQSKLFVRQAGVVCQEWSPAVEGDWNNGNANYYSSHARDNPPHKPKSCPVCSGMARKAGNTSKSRESIASEMKWRLPRYCLACHWSELDTLPEFRESLKDAEKDRPIGPKTVLDPEKEWRRVKSLDEKRAIKQASNQRNARKNLSDTV